MKKGKIVKLHNHGYVMLVDIMGNDRAIVDAARVSYAKGTRTRRNLHGLINYLMRHRHTSPFEMVELKFEIRAPIFVYRQWHRHRTWSFNEESGRYSEMKDECYLPEESRLREQSEDNKQGSSKNVMTDARFVRKSMEREHFESFEMYKTYLARKAAREIARINLPLSTYSSMVAKTNLLNFFRFCSLRRDSHAQEEIRDYANAMFELVRPHVPIACEAFEEHWLFAKQLSRSEWAEATSND